ncbi:bone morphogenetic protein 2-A-like [Python bivittatus]|uniref:Bone morphogenetic protein 2-A-like n=1 Tax=Python bivittatus TaxID=176946 RepID=A0A9F5MY63_PYTBI|nr:bone morphogenetic protein 2-A-like [Python bivittatus]
MLLLPLPLPLLAWAPACPARPAWAPEDTRDQALKKLLEVFGIEDPPRTPLYFKEPPQYMVDLYNTGCSGARGQRPPSASTSAHGDQTRLLFLLSSVAKNEVVLTAELHLFKLRARGPEGALLRRQHFCQISFYQVLDKEAPDAPEGKKLLSARLLAVHGFGWEVFSITQAVRDWVAEESSNQGLLVTVEGLRGVPLDSSTVQFASGRDHHASKNPMLVLFTDDGRRAAALPSSFLGSSPGGAGLPELTSNRTRAPRSAESPLPCQRYPLSVDFEEIGWSGWIISPRGYNAYHCKGSCPFPLGENMRPTNHATVQSIINALKLSQEVSSPCCVPDKLFSINLLYFDDDENVVLKQYDNMVAGSCGCH